MPGYSSGAFFGLALPLLLLLICAASPAQATVFERLTYRHYPVDAQADHPLYRAIDARSPIRQDGRVFHGFTRWQFNWHLSWFQRDGGRCYVTQVRIDLNGEIQLPELRQGSAAQRRVFDRYLAALRTHELGHFELGRQAATTIERRLMALPEMASCAVLEAAARRHVTATTDEFRQRERQYDQNTEHGKTQGAWLTE